MDTITRVVATVMLTALAGAGLVGCSSNGDGPGSEASAPPSAAEMTTTTTASSALPDPAGNPVDIPGPVAERWTALGGFESDLGAVTGPVENIDGGSVTSFERGVIVLTPEGRPFVVQGEILSAYLDAGGPAGELGFPTADEASTDGGWISTFDHGVITYLGGVAEVELG